MVLTACSGKSLELEVPSAGAASEVQGLAWWSRAAIDTYMRGTVRMGSRSGFVLMFARDGVPIYSNAAGWADIENEVPMSLDTRMRFASMTKPVTAVAAMQLVEQGRLGLDEPVSAYIPAFAKLQVANGHERNASGEFESHPVEQPILVRHLLMFASGIGPGYGNGEDSELIAHWKANGPRTHESGSLGERIDHLGSLPLFEEPGSAWRYGWSADVLARVVEVVSAEPFDRYVEQNILEPLGMDATGFRYKLATDAALATVYTQDEAGELVSQIPESDSEFPQGGSGLVSTVEDYMRFALMLWNEGEYQGVRLLKPETVRQMRSLQVPDGVLLAEGIEGLGWGLGMAVVADAEASLIPGRDGDFWWGGYFGTTFFVSPESGLVGVILSQNEPGPYSDRPVALYILQGLAYAGL
jgi:CubicO group peptidase (beta-lactamase class C family)